MIEFQKAGVALVVAPHPDDETLGVGGTLLRLAASGWKIHWLIGTAMRAEDGWPAEKIARRQDEITAVSDAYGFATVSILPFPAAKLDEPSMARIVSEISNVIQSCQPELVFVPHRGDAHSDHAVLHDATLACTKWFRYPSVRQVMAYETLSETDASVNPSQVFHPTVFCDVEGFLEEKIRIAKLFAGEFHDFPFPRSPDAMRALAQLRGTASGSKAAEAFMLLRAIV